MRQSQPEPDTTFPWLMGTGPDPRFWVKTPLRPLGAEIKVSTSLGQPAEPARASCALFSAAVVAVTSGKDCSHWTPKSMQLFSPWYVNDDAGSRVSAPAMLYVIGDRSPWK